MSASKSARLPLEARPERLYLTGYERQRLLAAVEDLHLLLSVRGQPVARGRVSTAIVELARLVSPRRSRVWSWLLVLAGTVPT